MPAMKAHKQAAAANKEALDYLQQRVDAFPQWVVTVAFYTALHVVEAVFAKDGFHTDKHEVRNRTLKKQRRYEKIWEHYQPLFNDSLIARYLQSDSGGHEYAEFTDYLSPHQVVTEHVNHNLRQVVLSARRLTGDNSILADDAPAREPHSAEPASS